MKNSKSGFKISLKSFIAEKMLFQYFKKTSSAWLQTNLRFALGFQNLVKQSISGKNLGHFGIYFLKIRQLVQKL